MENKRRTFTLIELLIAFAVFSVIAAGIYSTLRTGIRFYTQGNAVIAQNQKLRMFFDTIARDLTNAVDYEPYLETDWQASQIVFPAIIDVFGEAAMDRQLAKLKYSLDNGKLVRQCAGLKEGFNEEKAQAYVFLEGVEELNFEYCYQSLSFGSEYQWLKSWTKPSQKPNIPKGVKIRLSLRREGFEHPETFTKTVFIPLGQPGARISS